MSLLRFSALLPLLCFAALSWGQDTRGTIFGHVVDPQSAPVADARVTVTDTDTNVVTTLKTNESGYYDASL